MSKGLIAYFRHQTPTQPQAWAERLCARIRPDNAHPRQPRVVVEGSAVSVVYDPMPNLVADGLSFLLGASSESGNHQLHPDSAVPSGTFALLRAGGLRVAASTDYTASRTIWYCHTDEVFVAATSQRMISFVLGSFSPNQRALAWFLAGGALGPENAWDQRVHVLPGNSTVRFDAERWQSTLDIGDPLTVREIKRPIQEHKHQLQTAVEEAVSSMISQDASWVLALSGGMDSRSLLYHLQGNPNVEAVTWGLAESRDIADGDAAVAARLAATAGMRHTHWATDNRQDELDQVFSRFIAAGEGRVDHLSGYMDGLSLWSGLSSQHSVMIRGYDAFGTKPMVGTDYQARESSILISSADLRGSFLPAALRSSNADIPERLRQGEKESLSDWRDRLWLEYRTPYITAALDDVKFAYTEVVNPLLSRPVVEVVQTLPVRMRTRKRLFRQIVEEMFPGVPFARRDSVRHIAAISRQQDVKNYVRDRLAQIGQESPIPQPFAEWLAQNLEQRQQSTALRHRAFTFLSSTLPPTAKDVLRLLAQRPPTMDVRRVALRVVLADLATKQLAEDAASGLSNAAAGRNAAPAEAL